MQRDGGERTVGRAMESIDPCASVGCVVWSFSDSVICLMFLPPIQEKSDGSVRASKRRQAADWKDGRL